MIGLLRVSSLHLLPVTTSRPPDRDILVSRRDYRHRVEFHPSTTRDSSRHHTPCLLSPTLMRLTACALFTTDSKSRLSLAGPLLSLDRCDDLGPELSAYRELDEASGPLVFNRLTPTHLYLPLAPLLQPHLLPHRREDDVPLDPQSV